MKKLLTIVSILSCLFAQAQMGIGTTSPNSTLDVRGSISTPVTSFTGNTTAGTTDHLLIFTGTSTATLTLPTAIGIPGREYWIKNSSSNSSTLNIATTSSQTVDGVAAWSLTVAGKVLHVTSNGTNWYATAESVPGSAGTPWVLGGNNVAVMQNIGTTSNYSLPFITNNAERMRIGNTGNVAIGTTSWDGSNAEKLLVDAGTTSSFNVISGKGSINNYLQLNIQNRNTGAAASSDIVATADNGSESVNFVDLGINSSGYSSSGILGGANTAYLYTTGGDFAIGNASSSKKILFFTNGMATTNERMRIDEDGNVGINDASPTEKLDVNGNFNLSGAFMPNNNAGTAGRFLVSAGAGNAPIWFDASGYAWLVDGNTVGTERDFGTTDNFALPFITNNTERMRITNTGNVGIGTSSFSGTNPEKLIVDAGTNGAGAFQNVIVGKGNTNNYAQLNIQNNYSGTAAGTIASSDVVATSDNGNESVNFIDMGINSSGNNSTGVLGGANTAYLYATGNDFIMGNSTSGKNMVFFTGGTASTNERLKITGSGLIGIGNITPTSTMEVAGSVGYAITTTTTNLTLDATHHTVIITGGTPTITLPAASGCNRRIYVIVNQTIAARTTSSYLNFLAAGTTNVGAYSSITVQSNGTSWYRIQ